MKVQDFPLLFHVPTHQEKLSLVDLFQLWSNKIIKKKSPPICKNSTPIKKFWPVSSVNPELFNCSRSISTGIEELDLKNLKVIFFIFFFTKLVFQLNFSLKSNLKHQLSILNLYFSIFSLCLVKYKTFISKLLVRERLPTSSEKKETSLVVGEMIPVFSLRQVGFDFFIITIRWHYNKAHFWKNKLRWSIFFFFY